MKYDESVNQPQDFNESMYPGVSHEVLNTFSSNLKKKFQCLYEGTAKQGNPTLLNEIYTELYITESESGEISNEHEVRGFNEPQKEEYFRKRIRDQSLAKRIISHLKSSKSLDIMCHIPVFCWISAAVLEKMLSQAESGEIPKTLTQMYTHFLMAQISIKDMKYNEKKDTDKEMIFQLGKLAYEQLEKGNVIFYEEDLRECGIDVTEASVYSGLCTQIFREEFSLYQVKVFCFLHLKHVSLSELHQRAVDEALQSKNGHLDLFLRFLLGLSVKSNRGLLQGLMKPTRGSSESNEETVEHIKKKIRISRSPKKSINLFHCLNELGDHSIVEEIQQYLKSGTLAEAKLTSLQWSALVFFLLTSEQMMDVFELNKSVGRENASDKVVRKLLPVIKESRSAHLDDCNITDKGCAALASVLRSNLRELDLSGNKLLDLGMKHLSDGLKDSHCKLEKLKLRDCGITGEGCDALASALRSNPEHLTELDLSENKLGCSEVQLLSGLKDDPDYKLAKLYYCVQKWKKVPLDIKVLVDCVGCNIRVKRLF
ncbi:NACHT, LRR and PYD domains-containing protein 3-like [Sinocyclocheilus rhinocerous]|nr:PREDICTED: NACHT, LRR and PYD domains-containing protein 3-like [Sinocyclocheilus rhinocerous]